MAAIVGGVTAGCTYVYAAAIVTEPPSGLATVIVTGPAAAAGVVTLDRGRRTGRHHPRCPAEEHRGASLEIDWPLMVTALPPVVGPLAGVTLVMIGSDTGAPAVTYVNADGSV